MNTLNPVLHSGKWVGEPEARRAPWRIFIFLFLVFAFATPYEWDFTTRQSDLDAQVENAAEGSLGRRVAVPILAAYGLYCLTNWRIRRLRLNGLLGASLAALLLVALLSLLWAEDIALTARKLTVFFLLLISAAGMAVRFSLKEFMTFVGLTGAAVVVLGFTAEFFHGTFLVNPPYAVYQFAGVLHPNAMGAYCAIGAITLFTLAHLTERRWKAYGFLLLMLLCVGALLLTKSRTAFLTACVVLLCLWAASTDLKRTVITVIGLGMLLCILGIIYNDNIVGKLESTVLLGREGEGTAGSLSNRLPLWKECLEYVEQRPLLGYGYDSFWTPKHIYTISKHQGWDVPHSHNGYLEMLLSTGVIGLLLYLIVLATYLHRSAKAWWLSRDLGCLYAFLLLVWLCLAMITEKVYMYPVFPSFVCNVLLMRFAFVEAEEQFPEIAESLSPFPVPPLSHKWSQQ